MSQSLTPKEFVDKWSRIQLKEKSASQSHFNDVCALVDHKTPTEADPTGEFFTFEPYSEKISGKKGFVDAWFKGHFIWEYKGKHANLDKAYDQLLLYRESLGNPCLLITSDMERIIIHTNFTNTAKEVHIIDFERLLKGDGLDLLKRAFCEPDTFEPSKTKQQITHATADTFVAVAETLHKWTTRGGRPETPEQIAHFIIRLLFSLFAEDMGLLPSNVFTQLITYKDSSLSQFTQSLRNLFSTMRDGGLFGIYQIPHFNGGLFNDDFVPELPGDIIYTLRDACYQDWSSIDPSIFGTLFERIIDKSKRAQLGLHYTSKDDIVYIVEPVLMRPLRDHWLTVKQQARDLINKEQYNEANILLTQFADQVAKVRVLDPACGSGNFLYVALRQLLDLQKEVIAFSGQYGLTDIPLTVSPAQLYGIELDLYAYELAQITVWIGYLQWRFENGFSQINEPILRPLKNIEREDAVLSYDNDQPSEPEWPDVDVVIGNPPFLGDKKMRGELGDKYVDDLRGLYSNRLPGQSDLVCYWFEKARAMITDGKLKRAGLLATQGIRGGANRSVLDRIKETGGIFWAQSDRDWILDGATVHVSMVGFDDGTEKVHFLDNQHVEEIFADLTARLDLTKTKPLKENKGICFQGPVKVGAFDITNSKAIKMLEETNPSGLSNAEVIKPFMNASDITGRSRNKWIINFGGLTLDEASSYKAPFEYVKKSVKPFRDANRDRQRRTFWWRLGRSGIDLEEAKAHRNRIIVTPRVAKHRVFIWANAELVPDSAVVAIARDDDYLFGVLHSRIHELWARRKGTQLRDAESGSRYTPTTTFETFSFPWPLGQEPNETENTRVAAIAKASRKLNDLRQMWLFPKEIGVVIGQKQVNKRTLTNLYNALDYYCTNIRGRQHDPYQWGKDVDDIITLDEIEELYHIHDELDTAVLDAYGWPHNLSDEEILGRLLALNLTRASA